MTDDVSRETSRGDASLTPLVPIGMPQSARGVFPTDRVALAERYAQVLATQGVFRGLIGPREVPRLWQRHLLNSAVLQEAVPPGVEVCDIGSGAGLPGVVLAIARPDLSVVLVEPLLRRSTFLSEVVDSLGLDNVEVLRGRAEDLHGRRTFDVVTSRAVAPLDRLLVWSMPLVSPHGALVAMKGESVGDEITLAGPLLAEWKCAPPEVFTLGEGIVNPPTTILRVAWADPSQVGWPLAAQPRHRTNRRGRRGGK